MNRVPHGASQNMKSGEGNANPDPERRHLGGRLLASRSSPQGPTFLIRTGPPLGQSYLDGSLHLAFLFGSHQLSEEGTSSPLSFSIRTRQSPFRTASAPSGEGEWQKGMAGLGKPS